MSDENSFHWMLWSLGFVLPVCPLGSAPTTPYWVVHPNPVG
jgi:hypothetical protein